MRTVLIAIVLFAFQIDINSQSSKKFNAEMIDSAIIVKRGLQEKIRMLKEDCDWSQKIGKKIDVFWMQNNQGNFFGHSYEYILDCDNVRLIYWYDNPSGFGRPIDFMIEDLEDESFYVVAKNKHLKNKKKYQKILKAKIENKPE